MAQPPRREKIRCSGVSHDAQCASAATTCIAKQDSRASETQQRNNRVFPRRLGRLCFALRMFVLAMDMVLPPLNTEDRQEHRSAGDLSDNSAQRYAADDSGNSRDSRC